MQQSGTYNAWPRSLRGDLPQVFGTVYLVFGFNVPEWHISCLATVFAGGLTMGIWEGVFGVWDIVFGIGDGVFGIWLQCPRVAHIMPGHRCCGGLTTGIWEGVFGIGDGGIILKVLF